ncbi:response regulator transcription factor [Agrococcus sp. SL85]|uniref:response regulator n=1 Tax=Agrococcus sp. SL85 TaxID=2995141 RepID=UPI00226CFBFD|nr:response regulator transcription factor [Agrococcus sp. SL85]WAC65138.1 response regulator transcription factor [Agrococcus sp. SL85]
MSPIRVLIVDDEALMRHALGVFVSSADDMVVAGEAADGAAAVRACGTLRPDVVLMDMQMPVMNGADATRAVLEAHPGTRVIALTTFTSERFLIPALRAGATAYLVKDTEPDELVAAIRDVHEGSYVISPQVTRELVETVSQGPAARVPEPLHSSEQLSERELDIVRLLARGLSNAEIAGELHVSEATVKTHLGRVMAKWGVRDRVQTLIRAAKADLVRFH